MLWVDFDFHGKAGLSCLRRAGTGASAGPQGVRFCGLSFPPPPPELRPSHPRAHISSLGSRVQRWGPRFGTFGRMGREAESPRLLGEARSPSARFLGDLFCFSPGLSSSRELSVCLTRWKRGFHAPSFEPLWLEPDGWTHFLPLSCASQWPGCMVQLPQHPPGP